MELTFRFAQESDTPLILWFIRALAEYEHLADQVVADEATLKDQLFRRKGAEVLFALEDGKEVGFALFFHNFSTFLGRAGLYLEDLYVLPEHRGKGYGKALFRRLATVAVERGCGRMEWWCLDWNAPSIGFYKALGAQAMEEWTVYRLTGKAGRPGDIIRKRALCRRGISAILKRERGDRNASTGKTISYQLCSGGCGPLLHSAGGSGAGARHCCLV